MEIRNVLLFLVGLKSLNSITLQFTSNWVLLVLDGEMELGDPPNIFHLTAPHPLNASPRRFPLPKLATLSSIVAFVND